MPPTDNYISGKDEVTSYPEAPTEPLILEPKLGQDGLCSTSLDEEIRNPSSDNPVQSQAQQPTNEVSTETIPQAGKNSQLFTPEILSSNTTSISSTCGQVTAGLQPDGNNGKLLLMDVAAGTIALSVEPGHIAKELFIFCVKTYQESLPIIIKLGMDKSLAKMQEEMGRFALWGDSCIVSEGELDLLFKTSKDKYLKESTIISLCSIARTLDSCFTILNTLQEASRNPNSNATSTHTTEAGPLTKTLVDENSSDLDIEDLYNHHSKTEIDAKLTDKEVPRANYCNADEPIPGMWESLETLLNVVRSLMPEIAGLIEYNSGDDDDDPLDLRLLLLEAVEDIKDSLDSLFDLVPSIDELYLVMEETVVKEHRQARVSTIEPAETSASFEAQAYKINIQDKFPEVDEQLAETLAGVNWARHRRIREWAENHESKVQAQLQVAHRPSGTIFTDSGIGSLDFTFQKNLFSTCRSEISVTSFGTTNSTMSGGIRLPKAPVPLSPGITFECSICFKNLRGIDTNILWKKHVLRDLRPYSCLFDSCPEKTTTFESRNAWMAHEFNYHRPQRSSKWRCSGSCEKVYREREKFAQHLLKDHLEGIVTASYIDDIVDNCKAETLLESIFCPFCAKHIPENKRSIQHHVGTHMDEIALKALPINFECESNASSEDGSSEDGNIFFTNITTDLSDPLTLSNNLVFRSFSDTFNNHELSGGPGPFSDIDYPETFGPLRSFVLPSSPSPSPVPSSDIDRPRPSYLLEISNLSPVGSHHSSSVYPSSAQYSSELSSSISESDEEAVKLDLQGSKGSIIETKLRDLATSIVLGSFEKEPSPVPLSPGSRPLKGNDTKHIKLHKACQEGAIAEVKAILHQSKKYLNTSDNVGYPPLHVACMYGHLEVVKILINNGAWIDIRCKLGDTPLFNAVRNGYANVVKYLLEQGADAQRINSAGQTPLDANNLNREPPEVFQEIEGLLKAAIKRYTLDENNNSIITESQFHDVTAPIQQPTAQKFIVPSIAIGPHGESLPPNLVSAAITVPQAGHNIPEYSPVHQSIFPPIDAPEEANFAAEILSMHPSTFSPINTPKKVTIYTCELCHKIFYDRCDLVTHHGTHEYPFKCDFASCDYNTLGFSTNEERMCHQNNTHISHEKEWKCEFVPCPYKSKHENDFKKHMEKAHGYMRTKRRPRKYPKIIENKSTVGQPQPLASQLVSGENIQMAQSPQQHILLQRYLSWPHNYLESSDSSQVDVISSGLQNP